MTGPPGDGTRTTPGGPVGDRADVLGRDYALLLAGSSLSNLGDGVRLAALPLFAVTVTDSPLLVAGITATTFLPAVLLGPLGGVVIDRVDRRRLLVGGQLLRGVAGLVFVGMLVTGDGGIAAVYLLAVVLGAGEVIVDGAAQAVVPQLVPPSLLERANARLIRAQLVLDDMVGAALGGVLFTLGPVVPFAVDAATFLLGAGAVSRMRGPLPPGPAAGPGGPAPATDVAEAPEEGVAPSRTLGGELRDGLRHLLDDDLLRPMALTLGLTNLANATGVSVLVLLVVDELGAAEATYGAVLAAGAVGGFAGSLVAERVVARIGRARTLVGAVGATAVTNLALGLAPTAAVVAGAFALHLCAVVVFNVPARAVRQEVTPSHLLGRVVTSFRAVGYLGVPVGAVLGGLVTGGLGVRAAYLAGAGLLVLGTVAMGRAVAHLPPDRG